MNQYDISDQRMQQLVGYMNRRLSGNPEGLFRIYPPKAVLENPAIINAEDPITPLLDTKWVIVFGDGYPDTLTFSELMVMCYNLALVRMQLNEAVHRPPTAGTHKQVNVEFTLANVMRPDVVRKLLSQLQFEKKSHPNDE